MAFSVSACVLGLFLLSAGNSFVRSEKFVAPAKLVKYRESYIVRYQKATCEGPNGKLVLLGSDDPVVLNATGNLQVVTSAPSSGPKRPNQLWIQTLKEEPSTYTIRQSGNSGNCMTVDPDDEPGNILALDSCATDYTPAWFNYKLVRNDLPGCKKSNRNGWAVTITPRVAFDIGKNLCFSAPKTPGAHATLETCNQQEESQLFFINVPSIIRRLDGNC